MKRLVLTICWIILGSTIITLITYIALTRIPYIETGYGTYIDYVNSLSIYISEDPTRNTIAIVLFTLLFLLYNVSIYLQFQYLSRKVKFFFSFLISTIPFATSLLVLIFVPVMCSLLYLTILSAHLEGHIDTTPEEYGISTSTESILANFSSNSSNMNILDETCTISCQNNLVIREALKRRTISDFAVNSFLPKTTQYDMKLIVDQDVYLVGNNLIVNDVVPEKIAPLSKAIGEYYIDNAYPDMGGEELAVFKFVTVEEYVAIRNQRIDNYIAYLDDQLAKVEQYITEVQDYLRVDTYYQQLYGEYDGTGWGALVIEDQEYLNLLNETKAVILELKADSEEQKNAPVTEWGVFLPPNEIYIISQDGFEYKPSEYFHILTHEYLHFKSNNKEEELPQFFEEGLTEYYTMRAMQNDRQSIFYTDSVNIIETMSGDINDQAFWSIYLSKNEEELKNTLDGVYGTGFYDGHTTDFSAIVQGTGYEEELENVMGDINEKQEQK